jgi:hypothetical protein
VAVVDGADAVVPVDTTGSAGNVGSLLGVGSADVGDVVVEGSDPFGTISEPPLASMPGMPVGDVGSGSVAAGTDAVVVVSTSSSSLSHEPMHRWLSGRGP